MAVLGYEGDGDDDDILVSAPFGFPLLFSACFDLFIPITKTQLDELTWEKEAIEYKLNGMLLS